MSEYAAHKYGSREDLHFVMDKNIDGQRCDQYQSLWVTRWTGGSSNSISQSCKNCCVSDESDQKEYAKEEVLFPIKSLETRVARRSEKYADYRRSSSNNVMGCDSNCLDIKYDVHQLAETEEVEKDKCMFLNNFLIHKDVNMSSPKVSNTLSVHKLSDSAVDWEDINAHHFLTSDNPDTEWDHFPMFDINRKIEGILNPKRRSEFGNPSGRFSEPPKSLNETMSSSHVMALSSKEHQFRARRMRHYVDKRMEPYRSSEGLLPCQDDLEGFDSQIKVHRLKGHGQNTMSCSCSEDGNISSNSQCLVEEHSLRTNFTGLKQYNRYGHGKFMFSEVKSDSKVIGKSSSTPWSRTNGGSNKVPRLPSSGTSRFNDAKQSHQSLQKMPYCHIHDVQSQRVNSVQNVRGVSHRFSHATEYHLAEKSVAKAVTHKKQLIDSKNNTRVKRPALFEMLTLPAVQHDRKFQDSRSPRKSKSGQVYEDSGIGIDSNIEESQNELSGKTDTLYIDILQAPSSSAGVASSGAKKGVMFPNMIYCESAATSPITQMISRDDETELLGINLQHAKSSDKVVSASKREPSISRTLSLAGDHIFKNQENSSSSVPTEAPECLEQSSRWLKRLGHNLSDSLAIGAKRLKVGCGPSTGELLGSVINYNRSNSELMKYIKEQKRPDKMTELPNDCAGFSGVSVKSMQSWIGRWCHCDNPKEARDQANAPTTLLSDPEKSNMVPENLEGRHFPSIAAMAMMGKAMNKFRPCEFQRRGTSVVWNTEAV
ncbi:uncharacterized protein [Typha angustifolia]|uniref:uncharacterized protein isoform X2 n=1 Tax=Typha angustifolia TaxID=59011 RepID=UPI003C2D3ED5